MKGYYPSKGVRKDNYPDSKKESKKVLRAMKNPDEEYFLLSDKSPRTPFVKYLEEEGLDYDPSELKRIIDDSFPIIKSLKNYYNRPRPSQVNAKIKPFASSTASTPSYPSGHAFQAFLVAKHLSKKYPFRTFKFYSIAERIAKARVSVGLHYPSDNDFSRNLAQMM